MEPAGAAPVERSLLRPAAGGNDGSTKTKKHKKSSGGKVSKKKHDQHPTVNVSASAATAGFNLAGRPSQVRENVIKTITRESAMLYDVSTTNELYWQFRVQTNKSEWVRFFVDSITLQLYGRYKNPARNQGSAVLKEAAEFHALLAREDTPFMFLDPTVMGTSFIKDVEVIVNGVRVPTNNLNSHLLHYSRMCGIFCKRPRAYFATNKAITLGTGGRDRLSTVMQQATLPFDYGTWNATNGSRIPCYLDGKWPFDAKCATLEAVDGDREQTLFFPPETDILIKVHLFKDKIEAIFHDNCKNITDYLADANRTKPTGDLALTFQSVLCEYEKVILTETAHVAAMKDFHTGKYGTYPYDVPRSQFQALQDGQSYTENTFQIAPQCRLAYVLFLPSWAVFPMETTHKPLSAFSKFPSNSSEMRINFANEPNLITPVLEKFGDHDEVHQISKKIYYDHLRELGVFRGSFDELFPRAGGEESLIQAMVLDLKHLMRPRTEQLKIRVLYTERTSPKNLQILVLSVHPTGKATCKFGGPNFGWEWEFQNA